MNDSVKPISMEELDGYVNYSLDEKKLRDIVHRAVLLGETDLLVEAMLAHSELEHEYVDELLGEDCFNADNIVNQMDNKDPAPA